MTGKPLSLIKAAKSKIDEQGPLAAYNGTSDDWLRQFGERLEEFEPFRTIANSWVSTAMGGGITGRFFSARAVWHRLLAGAEPENLLRIAADVVETNRYVAHEIRPVRGIKVGARRNLADDVSLCPNDELERSGTHAAAFSHPVIGPGFPTETAALVHRIVIGPALLPGVPESGSDTGFSSGRADRDAYAARLRLALGLIGGGPVEMPLIYAAPIGDCIFGDGGGYTQTPMRGYFGTDVEVDLSRVEEVMAQLLEMRAPRALELSVGRLLNSRLSHALEDRIIDLGMAAEIALMHHAGGGRAEKSEITNKIGTRGAWLLGTSSEDRLRLAAMLGDLYSARSAVVHTGEADGKLAGRLKEFDKLATDIALALLRRGTFPDWKSLVLGGE